MDIRDLYLALWCPWYHRLLAFTDHWKYNPISDESWRVCRLYSRELNTDGMRRRKWLPCLKQWLELVYRFASLAWKKPINNEPSSGFQLDSWLANGWLSDNLHLFSWSAKRYNLMDIIEREALRLRSEWNEAWKLPLKTENQWQAVLISLRLRAEQKVGGFSEPQNLKIYIL